MRTTKFAALFAAVALLVVGATFAAFADWAQETDGWVYYDKNGDLTYDAWKQSGDGWYYLNEDGIMATDTLVEYKDQYYYVDASGRMVTSNWVKVTDEDYATEFDDDVDFRWFYLGSDGKAYKNAKKDCPTADGTKTFIFGEDGKMLYGWVVKKTDNTPYAHAEDYGFDKDGEFYCGDANDGAVVKADWRELVVNDDDDTSWFYFKAGTGAKYTGENKSINGKTYSFNEFGEMESSWATTASIADDNKENVFFGDDGAKVTKGWFYTWNPVDTDAGDDDEEDKVWYYAKNKNELAVNTFVSDGGKFYFLGQDGALVSGLVAVKWNDKEVAVVYEAFDDYDDAKDFVYDENTFLYYCNEEHDGSFGCVLTGSQKIDEDVTLTLEKKTTMAKGNGRVLDGASGNQYYTLGEKVTGDASENRYWFIEIDAAASTDYDPDAKKLDKSGIVLKDEDAVNAYKLWKDNKPATGNVAEMSVPYACFSASGTFYKEVKSKKDTDGYKILVENWVLKSIDNSDV